MFSNLRPRMLCNHDVVPPTPTHYFLFLFTSCAPRWLLLCTLSPWPLLLLLLLLLLWAREWVSEWARARAWLSLCIYRWAAAYVSVLSSVRKRAMFASLHFLFMFLNMHSSVIHVLFVFVSYINYIITYIFSIFMHAFTDKGTFQVTWGYLLPCMYLSSGHLDITVPFKKDLKCVIGQFSFLKVYYGNLSR